VYVDILYYFYYTHHIYTDNAANEIRRGHSDPSPRLFIRNLWFGTTEEALKEKFPGCTRVNIPIDPKSGSNKG